MCRDGNLRIPSPTTGNTAQRAATPRRSQPLDQSRASQPIYSGCTFNKALNTKFKVKMTRLLPLNTIAAEAPITAKKGEYCGADILLAR